MSLTNELLTADPDIYKIRTRAPGPAGSLPISDEMLRQSPPTLPQTHWQMPMFE